MKTPTVIMLVQAYLKEQGSDDESRGYLVHRLDQVTSGLMCVAKTRKMAQFLSRQMHDKSTSPDETSTIQKHYLALVCQQTPSTIPPLPNTGVIRQSSESPEFLWQV